MRTAISFLLLTLCGACALQPQLPADVHRAITQSRPDALLLGEQHDAPAHQDIHRAAIEQLGLSQRLGAVALEMAEKGTSTAGLPSSADEAAVRAALRWEDQAWPWAAYRGAIMAGVRAGVPVLGANLPRAQMRAAMGDSALDTLLPAAALQAQQQAMRDGHCGLLPESQIGPMARIQVARDRAMAQTIASAVTPGKTVVLLAGAGHVDPALGVPQHLPASLRVAPAPLPARPPQKDYCAEMRRQMQPAPKPG